jgi:hypothetical protein
VALDPCVSISYSVESDNTAVYMIMEQFFLLTCVMGLSWRKNELDRFAMVFFPTMDVPGF